jgi:hypothetical protein
MLDISYWLVDDFQRNVYEYGRMFHVSMLFAITFMQVFTIIHLKQTMFLG